MSTDYENKFIHRLIEHGFPGKLVDQSVLGETVVPCNGQGRELVPAWRTAMQSGDVVLGFPDGCWIVEVKKTQHASKCRPTGGGNVEQWEQMHRFARMGVGSAYAARHTSGSLDGRWRVHVLEGDPSVTKTLYREDGLLIPEFVDLLLGQS